ncbi:MAG: hypothetical protein BWY91_03203 [bacterium ADurb.BinA028]|nr:MAG: hypothetical protein BWY91_03203 [bacterium ADurb.BinA028]
MHPAAGRRGRGAQVDTLDAEGVRVRCDPRSEGDLAGGVGAGSDVSSHIVGVVGLEPGGVPRGDRQDPIVETGGEPLNLGDHRVGRVALIAVRHVGVGIHRVGGSHGSGRVDEVLLAEQDERPIRHPTARRGGLGCDDLLGGAPEVQRPGSAAVRVCPGDVTVDRKVDLERGRPVGVARQRGANPGRQPVADDLQDTGGSGVQHDDLGRGADQVGQAVQRPDVGVGHHRAAELG